MDTEYVYRGSNIHWDIKDGWFAILAYRENGEVHRIWFIYHG